jgi:hypothetical protein
MMMATALLLTEAIKRRRRRREEANSMQRVSCHVKRRGAYFKKEKGTPLDGLLGANGAVSSCARAYILWGEVNGGADGAILRRMCVRSSMESVLVSTKSTTVQVTLLTTPNRASGLIICPRRTALLADFEDFE